jgi:hypothetical protein
MVFGFFLVTGFAGCGPSGGIEVGNPDFKRKTVTLNPEGGTVSYAIQIIDDSTAAVSQIKAEGFETVSASYAQNGAQIILSVVFSDGTQLSVSLAFDADGNLSAVSLTLNGQATPTGFQQGEDGTSGEGNGSVNAALLLSGALCERVVACNTSFLQEDCEANVEAVPGLGHEFGDPQNQTLAESAAGIESGEVSVAEEALQECLAGIEIVTCQAVQKDFNDEDPPNYNQIRKLIPKPICAQGILQGGGNP